MSSQQGHIPVAERSDSVDIEKLIERNPCAKEYYELEECMGEHDRKWSLCQKFVHALKNCNQSNQKKQ